MQNNKKMKASILCGVAIVMGYSTPVLAQNAQPSAADQAASSAGAGDIVVTAQRRSQFARDVPISITALSGETLSNQGIKDTISLAEVTPGLHMTTVGNFSIPAMRGISTALTGPGEDNNVAIYLDGVYQPEATVDNFDLPDVERVEVLKGPQGTLFGRNATGGAIQVFTKEPQMKTTGNLTLGYGSYHDLYVKGFVTTPLIDDKVAISVATSFRKSDSYYHNIVPNGPVADGVDSKVVRGKLLIKPNSGLKILVTALYSDHSDPTGNLGMPLGGNTEARLLDPQHVIVPTKPWTYASNGKIFQDSKVSSVSGKIAQEIGDGTLTSLTSYSNFQNYSLLNAAYAATTNGQNLNYGADSTNRDFTEELTYASHSTGKLNYTFGLYYINGWAGWTPLQLQTPQFTANIYSRQNYKSIAGFGEIYYNITDALSITLGGRYSWEKRDLSSVSDFSLKPYPPENYIGAKSSGGFTPRAVLKYDLNNRSNVYFSYSQGFKSSVFDSTALGLQAPVPPSTIATLPANDPEKIYAYEIGYKGRATDWLNLTAAADYYNYKHLQVQYYVPGPGGLPIGQDGNIGGADLYGAEVDANMHFNRFFDARVGAAYEHTSYKDFHTASINTPNTDVNGNILLTGNYSVPYDGTGKSMLLAPKFTIYTTATYHADLAGGILDLSGTVYHSSSLKITYDGRVSQKAWETYDARIAWTPENRKFTVSAIGKNLSNAAVISGTFIQAAADGISFAPPRTFALQLDVPF